MRVRVRGYITGARVLHRGPKLIPLAPTGSSAAWLGIARGQGFLRLGRSKGLGTRARTVARASCSGYVGF